MTIGIDARFFGPRAKGLGRYTQKLISELEKQDKENNFIIFLRQTEFDLYQPANPRFKKILANWRWYSLAEQIFMPLTICRQKVDLMHFPHFNVPFFWRGPFVITIHDLILQHFPTHRASKLNIIFYWLKYLAYRVVISSAIKRSLKIITISNFVKEDIIKNFNVPREKIVVIYEGAPNSESKMNSALSSEQKNKTNPYLLYVGNAYPHKNLEKLIEAWFLLRKKRADLSLVLVGEDDYFYQRLRKKAPSGVFFAGFKSDEELINIYQQASVYVFPSLCEGFGLPPLEAMAYGVPVVAAETTCLPEILGEAALYFNPESVEDIASKINEVLENEKLYRLLQEKGFEQIKKYSWSEMARQTLKIYNNFNFKKRHQE